MAAGAQGQDSTTLLAAQIIEEASSIMNRFGNDYNPYGRDRDRFESQVDFNKRCEVDKQREERREEAALERRREESEIWD